MTAPVFFADVEALLVSYLTGALTAYGRADVTVGTGVPPGRGQSIPAASFVRVRVTGGARTGTVVDRPTVVLESWDDDEVGAAALAALIRGLISVIQVVEGVQFYSVTEMSRPQNLTDPVSQQHRYTQTLSISYRGTTAA